MWKRDTQSNSAYQKSELLSANILEYRIFTLTSGLRYNVNVKAISLAGDGEEIVMDIVI